MHFRRLLNLGMICGVSTAFSVLLSSTAIGASTTAVPAGVKPQGINCPANAPIKGNIRKGVKIYHLPSASNYQQVKPETCFPTADAAQKAGFHPPGSHVSK